LPATTQPLAGRPRTPAPADPATPPSKEAHSQGSERMRSSISTVARPPANRRTPVRSAKRPPLRRSWILAGVAVALSAILVAGIYVARRHSGHPVPEPAATATVATVNGTAVPLREFSIFLAKERASTFTYFQQKYRATDGPAFWTTRYGGQTPADYLKHLALGDVTRVMVQLQLADKY